MPLTKRLFRTIAVVILAAVAVIFITPFAVAQGVRLWLSWQAREQNLILKIDKISAPLLRPVVIQGIQITSGSANAFNLDIKATQATLNLNLGNIIRRGSGRAIRMLSIEGLQAETHRNRSGSFLSASGWMALQKILPGTIKLGTFDLRLEDGPTVLLLRNATLSASEIEAGQFTAGEIKIVSPWFRQTFGQLHGATNWQNNRLTIGGLSLARGLDLEWISFNLGALGQQRADVDLDADAFGGKIRASITDEWSADRSTWNLVGWTADISLAETSAALGFTDRIDGLLHAGKFTFRGDPRDQTNTTASLWMELTDLKWRRRAAESIMFGASFYNRQIEIQQLYVKQSENELTLSGQASLQAKSSDWLSTEFRGDISATINQLGDFAALFGANPGDFAGGIAIEGTMNTRDRKFGGHLNFTGTSLTLFRTAIDSLDAKLNLKAGELEIEELQIKRNNDLLSGQGKIDLLHEHHYSGSLSATISDLADYLSIFCGPEENEAKPTPATIEAKIESDWWNLHGTINLPGSSPVDVAANFRLPIGVDWKAFQASPINLMLDFPSIFLANAPQLFHPQIFRDGILTGKIALSETLRHPYIVGEVQLINGKLENASLNLTEASSQITFTGNGAAIDFFNVTTKDVDLALRGGIDCQDVNDLVINLVTVGPIFDLTAGGAECVSKIEIEPVAVPLAPVVTEMEIHGGPFHSWTINLKEQTSTEKPADLSLNQIARALPLCLGQNPEKTTLLLGAPPRPEPQRPAPRPKKRPHFRY